MKNKANGGTMILWKMKWDPFVTLLPRVTSSFIAILFMPPGSQPTVHICIYFPTSGKEPEFVEEVIKLRTFIQDILDGNPDYIFIYLFEVIPM